MRGGGVDERGVCKSYVQERIVQEIMLKKLLLL